MTQARTIDRRPVAARNARPVRVLAAWLAQRGCPPNVVSLLSLVASALAGAALLAAGASAGPARLALLAAAATGIALRGLCNLLDGLIAVEGGRRTPAGEIYNDLPDRFSDLIVFVGAGLAAGGSVGPALGWLAGAGAVLVAYVRVLGAAAGAGHDFRGPMAKTGRLVVLVIGIGVTALEPWWGGDGEALSAALVVIVLGCAATMARRAAGVVRALEAG